MDCRRGAISAATDKHTHARATRTSTTSPPVAMMRLMSASFRRLWSMYGSADTYSLYRCRDCKKGEVEKAYPCITRTKRSFTSPSHKYTHKHLRGVEHHYVPPLVGAHGGELLRHLLHGQLVAHLQSIPLGRKKRASGQCMDENDKGSTPDQEAGRTYQEGGVHGQGGDVARLDDEGADGQRHQEGDREAVCMHMRR